MANAVQVVLQTEVANLGDSGDIVRVKPGYARNYLIPRGLAAPATKSNVARVDELKRLAAARAKQALAGASELKAKLEATSVKLTRTVGEGNKMYGSVTAKDIADAYEAAGLAFDRKKLHMGEPIKTLGLHEVPLKLHHEVSVTLRVEVVKQAG